MASVNRVTIVGNLGADPEVRYTPNGDQVTNIRVATTDKWKDKASGEMREATEWHRIVFYRRLAEVAGQYLKKGSQVYIEGRLKTHKWQDSSGQDRYTTQIEATELVMLGSRQSDDAPRSSASPSDYQRTRDGGAPRTQPATNNSFSDFEDDIPF